ncbi:hypothetical protein AB838_11295 [Rhodobacteraceae bacterium (ex Bugula neritina AB1)]|nr:hypothetical protein AB838_11295 [Rhodobacteraceae bacterium (ex Bugula neritina AB1)]
MREARLEYRPGRSRTAAMIIRSHTKGDAPSTAVYSDCETYRYSLTRVWDPEGQRVLFVMLNPSTATEVQNDPTIERCERRARALGFGGFRAANIFACRVTDPREMRRLDEPEGSENMAAILEGMAWADTVICAWGTHGEHRGQGARVEEALRATGKQLHHLGLSKAGHPKHPLYIAYSQQPQLWRE